MAMRIVARQKANAAMTTWNYWRTKVMQKNVLQVLLLSMFVLYLPSWVGAQSIRDASTSSTNASSSAAAPTEQQEMRDELRALRAEVERLRAKMEQQQKKPRLPAIVLSL